MTQQQFERIVQAVRYVIAAFAVIAAFLLAQGEVDLGPVGRVVLGCYIAFAAFVNPASVARQLNPAAPPRPNAHIDEDGTVTNATGQVVATAGNG